MCLRDQLDKIIAAAESGIDLKKVLYPVAVVAVEMTALPKDWAPPDRRDAQGCEVVEFAGDSCQCPTLVAVAPRQRPDVPSPTLAVGLPGARICQFRPIEERSIALGAVAEPIDQQEVDNLVLPGIR